MRTIKFRAWDKKDKYMFKTMVIFNPDTHPQMGICQIVDKGVPEVRFVNQDDFELMQFTGLKDKNGKEIYEGDIVRFQHLICEVYYAYGMFNLKYPNGNLSPSRDFAWGELNIIGNIYENPELLKQST